MPIRIATWNVNSVRLRVPAVQRLVDEHNPDVLCLQETKVHDDAFPLKSLKAAGFEHIAISGQKSYNGVAILSRLPLEQVDKQTWCGREDCRHLSAVLPGGIELHNFYVPAGGDVPDPDENDKFAHKLAFMQEMTDWFGKRRRKDNKLVLVGDLNVAPHENDVWSHKQLLKVVSHTPVEVEAMGAMYRSHDWTDAVRHFIPTSEKIYSWWSYRSPNWSDSDKGRRLDHVWVTPALKPALRHAEIVRAARGWDKPSDHVPVIVSLDVSG
ncbi:MAG: exodeoxyribonuclease III [Minwuiales bacterium]|nr:exodeoxyribonuclease III [Minwuiales bacterium]